MLSRSRGRLPAWPSFTGCLCPLRMVSHIHSTWQVCQSMSLHGTCHTRSSDSHSSKASAVNVSFVQRRCMQSKCSALYVDTAPCLSCPQPHAAQASGWGAYILVKAVCVWCRGQVGKQVVDQLSVEYVRELAAFEAKELLSMFGTVTGVMSMFDHCRGLFWRLHYVGQHE